MLTSLIRTGLPQLIMSSEVLGSRSAVDKVSSVLGC